MGELGRPSIITVSLALPAGDPCPVRPLMPAPGTYEASQPGGGRPPGFMSGSCFPSHALPLGAFHLP